MRLYGAIDLHSNNSYIVILDEDDRVVFQKRLRNDLALILSHLSPYQSQLQGMAVESTFNWYWLVDGLMEAGIKVHLVNTTAVQQYKGLKYTDDSHDARWLAHLLRLGILPEGYIYPKENRPIRDLLRKRSQLVRHRTTQILSIQNLMSRNIGSSLPTNKIKKLSPEDVDQMFGNPDLVMAVKANVTVMRCLIEQVSQLEKTVLEKIKLHPSWQLLQSVNGIGVILSLTIMLETGDIARFSKVGHFASYCRCVDSKRISNGKKKGEGNGKNGNRYLSWAFLEAAHYGIRYSVRFPLQSGHHSASNPDSIPPQSGHLPELTETLVERA